MNFLIRFIFLFEYASSLYIFFFLVLLFYFIKIFISYRTLNFTFAVEKFGFLISQRQYSFLRFLSVVISFVILITSPFIHDVFKIEDLRIKTSGYYIYNVVVEGQKLPARIYIEYDKLKNDRHYYMDELLLNGHVLYFDSSEELRELTYDDYAYIYVSFDDDQPILIKLTNEHSYSDILKDETDHFHPVYIVWLILKEIIVLLDFLFFRCSFKQHPFEED